LGPDHLRLTTDVIVWCRTHQRVSSSAVTRSGSDMAPALGPGPESFPVLACHDTRCRLLVSASVMARQPNMVAARNSAVTVTKLHGASSPVNRRNVMPPATVIAHTNAPTGQTRKGLRHARVTTHPNSRPATNGQAIPATAATAVPVSWSILPITTKASTHTTSAARASGAAKERIPPG